MHENVMFQFRNTCSPKIMHSSVIALQYLVEILKPVDCQVSQQTIDSHSLCDNPAAGELLLI